MAVDVELTGIRLIGPLPLGTTEITLKPGLTAIGGVNGAGKSTVLRALGEALSGQLETIDGADFIFSLTEVIDPQGKDLLHWISRVARLDRNNKNPRNNLPTFDVLISQLRDGSSALVQGNGRGPEPTLWGEQVPGLHESLLGEVAAQGHLCYSMRRHETTVRAALFFAGKNTSSTPVLTSLLEQPASPETAVGRNHWLPATLAQIRIPLSELATSLQIGHLPIPIVPISRAVPRPVGRPRNGGVAKSHIEGLMTVERLAPVEDPDRATTVRLAEINTPNDGEARPGETKTALEILNLAEEWAAALSVSATTTWRELRQDQAQDLMCRVVGDPSDWSDGRFFAWETKDARTSETHPISQLSGGQLRWAGLSVAFALSDRSLWPERQRSLIRTTTQADPGLGGQRHWWLLDEPELGIHRNVERAVGEDLRDIAHRRGLYVVAATHSSAIMTAADEVLATSRTNEGIHIRKVRGLPTHMRDLGLDPMDAMGWFDGFLLVEGHHDKAVIEGFLGQKLQSLRIKTYCLGGSKNLPAALLCQFLADVPHAAVIGVLDNMTTTEASEVWFKTRNLNAQEGWAAAKAYLDATSKGRGTEWKGMKQFYLEALGKQFESRASVIGLPRADVLRYLPPRSLCAAMPETWEEVALTYSKEHQVDVDLTTWAPDKNWLEARFDFKIGDKLNDAVAITIKTEPTPDDLQALIGAIEISILDSQRADRVPRIPHVASGGALFERYPRFDP